MKINKKISALVLAGALACTTPAMVYAQDSSDVVDQAVEILRITEWMNFCPIRTR